MKVWIFEPWEWDYCGGALVIAADTLEACQSLLDKQARKDNAISIKNSPPPAGYTREPDWQHLHDKAPTEKFICNHWLVSHVLDTTETKSRVMVENWNYG